MDYVYHRGFILIVESDGLTKAYRNERYLDEKLLAYSGTELLDVIALIDQADDQGELSPERVSEIKSIREMTAEFDAGWRSNIIFDSGNGGPAFGHYLATGKYLWKGTEYTHIPRQLEVDTGRGVVYLHNLLSGRTDLRVCRVPDDIIRMFEVGTVVIDLVHTPVRRGGKAGRIIKKEPVFLEISGAQELLAGELPGPGEFSITDEAGLVYFEFKNVPANLIEGLWFGNFVDITLGYTGRGKQ